jgi:predicted DNA-binding transcriptional regulator
LSNDQNIGFLLLAIGAVGILVYAWLIFFAAPLLMLQITAFVAVAAVLGIVAWIGYTMATTPPPEPVTVTETPETETETTTETKSE